MAGPMNLLILAIIFISSSVAEDYCNIETCKKYSKGVQTLCKYPQSGPAQACLANGDMGGGISEDDKNTLIDLHNKYRQKVASGGESEGSPGPQPAASSMPDLTWDDELATIAQRWADQCIWDHDDCRDDDRYQVGQNIAWKGTTGDIDAVGIGPMLDDWYNEVAEFDSSIVPSYIGTSQMTGHYTQMVWAKTTKIGCGLRNYFDGKFNRKYLVCNYGPSGNMKHEPVYETQ